MSQCGVCRVDLRSTQAGQVGKFHFKSHLFIQSLVKRHRYAERMQEEVEKLREKRRGLGIGQEVPGTTNQTIGVEEEEEDTVLEHKTIKKAKVGEDFPRSCGQ